MDNKRTKIVCTIGPSTWIPENLKGIIEKGMNVARINGAFADLDELKRVAEAIRAISNDVALMLDIKGHEVRLNKFDEPIPVKEGDEVVLGQEEDRIYTSTYLDLYKDINPGQIIIIDKGAVELVVEKIEDKKIYCRVKRGDIIKGGKGMNIPGSHLSNPPLTAKDIEQIDFVIKDNWDFVAASFIRNENDILEVRKHLGDSKIQLIAKIEDQQGVDNFESILKVSDGIMIARGDMGSEIPFERLPIIQKEIIYACNQAAKPVITATNMLESMVEAPFPTRAEITDVANAVLDGSDSLMTSAETSSGKYPIASVETMTKISKESEKHIEATLIEPLQLEDKKINVAMANAAYEMYMELEDITKIVVFTQTGATARIISRLNIPVDTIAFVMNDTVKRQLNLTKGIKSFVINKTWVDRDQVVKGMIYFGIENNIFTKSDKILLIGNSKRTSENGQDPKYPNIFEYIEISEFLDKE